MPDWPAAILFDFDGVIVNSEPLHCRGFQEVLAAEGITLTDEEYYAQLIGFDDRGGFAHVFKLHGRPLDADTAHRLEVTKAAVIQRMIDTGNIPILPGVDAFVRAVAAAGYPIAICSGALRLEIERMLDGIGLRRFFPVIVAADDVAVSKPDPTCYLQTVEQLSAHAKVTLTAGDCLIIEDSPLVIHNAQRVGFRAVGVATSHPMDALKGADFAVEELSVASVKAKIPQLRVEA